MQLQMLMNSEDVGKSFEDKLSTIEESASLEGQVSQNKIFIILLSITC